MLINKPFYSIFFDADTGIESSNGKDADTSKDDTTDVDDQAIDDHLNDDPLSFGEEDIDDMTDDSPIVTNAETTPESKKQEEKIVDDDNDSDKTEIDKKTDDDKKPDETDDQQPSTFKIGEEEYNSDELTRIIKEHSDMESWEKNLRNLEHLKNLKPELVEAMVPWVLTQKDKLPKNLVDEPLKTSVVEQLKDLELEIPYTDDAGDEQLINVDLEKVMPVIEKVIELTTAAHQPKIDQAKATEEAIKMDRMNELVSGFTKDKTDVFTFHKGKNTRLIDHINAVRNTPGHIDAKPVKLLGMLVNMIDGNEIKTLDEAYEFWASNRPSKTSDVIEKIVKNQKKGKAETPGPDATKVDDGDMPDIDDSAEDVLEQILK